MATRVFVIDDHPVIITGLKLAFGVADGFELIGQASDGTTALAKLSAMTAVEQPNALIVDLILDGTIDYRALRHIRALLPRAIIIAFSSLPEDSYAAEAVESGANDYVSKKQPLEYLIGLIAALRSNQKMGGAPVSPRRPALTLAAEGPALIVEGVSLTKREYEVCRMLAVGENVISIASALNISSKTVAAHRENVRRKFGCRNSTELVVRLARMQRTKAMP